MLKLMNEHLEHLHETKDLLITLPACLLSSLHFYRVILRYVTPL